jgi:hypothetical protein
MMSYDTTPAKAFILLQECWGKPAGTRVYELKYHDYGLARDDTNHTGIEHESVTMDPMGNYPSFTVPKHFLAPAP